MEKFLNHVQKMEAFAARFNHVPAFLVEEGLEAEDLAHGLRFRKHLQRLLKTAKRQYQNDRVQWITYLLAAIVACPQLLLHQGDLKWVREEVVRVLLLRYFGQQGGIFLNNGEGTGKSPFYAQEFWEAWRMVAHALTSKGRPSESGRHFALANEVRRLMEEEGLSTDAAVVKLGLRLRKAGLSRGRSQRDQIYESLRFVKESGYWEDRDINWSDWLEKQQKEDPSLGLSDNVGLPQETSEHSPELPPDLSRMEKSKKRKQQSKKPSGEKPKGKKK